MNKNIRKLSEIASRESRLIIGLMSGTSLDGLDVALCRCAGSGIHADIKLERFQTVPYEMDFADEIRSIFSKRSVDLEKVCLLNAWVAQKHADIVNNCLHKWNISHAQVDLLASHGQSIYHAPRSLHGHEKFGNATLQIGDGDHLAVRTGIITVSDFRQKHIAAGGEGAPLAAYGDYLLFSSKAEDRIMLNIGGIANFTYLPRSLDASVVFSTDTGPGNTLMDAYMQKHFNLPCDKNAAVAMKGQVNASLLGSLTAHDFFTKGFPKTTGPELFNLAYLDTALQLAGVTSLSHFDVMATLNRFTAITIDSALQEGISSVNNFAIYTSGGGMHNPLLMKHLRTLLPASKLVSTSDLYLDPDAKEAVLFAVLANECIAGGDTVIGNVTREIPSVSMGKISFPF